MVSYIHIGACLKIEILEKCNVSIDNKRLSALLQLYTFDVTQSNDLFSLQTRKGIRRQGVGIGG